jgi:DNA-binding CsgD family transcriptional regulator/catechol 2,3-dioxygenase-like lactoylglutathione lyase family enzyme
MSDTKRGRPAYPDVLTPAEWQIMNAVRHGMTNRQIARRRGVSLDAVKFHVANALSKLGVSDRRALRSWAGVPANSALKRRSLIEMSGPLQLGPIGQISRVVRDIRVSEAWFKDVLRLPHIFTFGNLAFFDCGGTRLFLSPPENGEAYTEQSCLYFRVDDIHAAAAELEGRGVIFKGAPHLIHRHENGMEEWMAFFEDPDGSLLALMSQVMPSA